MICQFCGKAPATVHFTEIKDQQMKEIHVCERCAEEQGMHTPVQQHKFDIADMVAHMVDSMTESEDERIGHVECPRCGMPFSALKETGRLGCSDCYTAFRIPLRRTLRQIHGDTHHRGKVPTRTGAAAAAPLKRIQQLHDQLRRAVEREEFESAAQLRDEIRRLEAEVRGTVAGEGA